MTLFLAKDQNEMNIHFQVLIYIRTENNYPVSAEQKEKIYIHCNVEVKNSLSWKRIARFFCTLFVMKKMWNKNTSATL